MKCEGKCACVIHWFMEIKKFEMIFMRMRNHKNEDKTKNALF